MPHERQCQYCKQFFTPRNPKAIFCSGACRVAYFRYLRKLNQAGLLATQMLKSDEYLEELEEFNKFLEVLK